MEVDKMSAAAAAAYSPRGKSDINTHIDWSATDNFFRTDPLCMLIHKVFLHNNDDYI